MGEKRNRLTMKRKAPMSRRRERSELHFRHYMSQNQGHDASETSHGSAETSHGNQNPWDVSVAASHLSPQNALPPLYFARRPLSQFFGKLTAWPVDAAHTPLQIKIAIFAHTTGNAFSA